MSNTKPVIIVSREDHEELIDLALKGLGRAPGASLLLQEMQRAKVAPTPPHVLAMHDHATFVYDGSTYRDYQLVYPTSANFDAGRISVLTPVGAALIGLAEEDEITWSDERGGQHQLKLMQVRRAH